MSTRQSDGRPVKQPAPSSQRALVIASLIACSKPKPASAK
jgi:hypothetical protein